MQELFPFPECCKRIIAASAKTPKQLTWAVNYARAGLAIHAEHDTRVQALYLLNNISSWRGEEAKQVRASLKKIGGEK